MKRFLLALGLAPTAAVAVWSALGAAAPVARQFPRHLPFLAGLAAYPLVHLLLIRPTRVYVFGHELTHALAAVLSGSRVRRFVAGRGSGHVVVEGSNAFIALAPYFIPIYSVLTLAAWRLAAVWVPEARLRIPFLALMGASVAFHCVLTLDILTVETQKDLKQAGGVFFSLTAIALANAAVLVLLFKTLFPASVSLRGFALDVAQGTAQFWRFIAECGARFVDGIRNRP